MNKNNDICVLGLGYIGLPTASMFATKGNRVVGVDVVPEVVETINRGEIHIEEPGLDILVKEAVNSGNLIAASQPALAETYIIAVPTPYLQQDTGEKVPDLSYIESAIRSIAQVVPSGALVILESTSPVGTTEKIRVWLYDELVKIKRIARNELEAFGLQFAHCPERILPGQMLKELISNDRIAGGLTAEASARARQLYARFCTGEIVMTDARTAEMAKLTENSFRDVNIAFANELSMICETLKIDVWELIRLANRHPRVRILQPGPGVGGHCIAVDPWFIVDADKRNSKLIRTAREVNDHKPNWVIDKIIRYAKNFKNPVIACFGLTFKANVDDIRESPSIEIVKKLCDLKLGNVNVIDPHVRNVPTSLRGKVQLCDIENGIRNADIVVLLVSHSEFETIDKTLFADKCVIDTQGKWSVKNRSEN